MKKFFKLFIVMISFIGLVQNLHANEQEKLKESFLQKISQVVEIVKDTNLTKDERNGKIVKLLTPTFDFEIMAKLSLGSKEWGKLTPTQKEEFEKLYVERMKQSYSAKLDSYNGEEIAVSNIVQEKENRIELVTNIVNQEKNLEVIYKYYKPAKPIEGKDAWLIYDVSILGISILKTDRAQFSEFLQTKSIDELIAKLSQN